MLDVILAVDDASAWHAANRAANAAHYAGSLGRLAPPAALAAVQRAGGGRLWYNTLVPVPAAARGGDGGGDGGGGGGAAREMKYGVIATADLVDDLSAWTSLYAAGRLHKPVVALTPPLPAGDALADALDANARAALAAALLLAVDGRGAGVGAGTGAGGGAGGRPRGLWSSPRRVHVTPRELFVTLAGLSYGGDFRMDIGVGEAANKVGDIVDGNLHGFQEVYAPHLERLGEIVAHEGGGDDVAEGGLVVDPAAPPPTAPALPTWFAVDASAAARRELERALPGGALRRAAREGGEALERALRAVVRRAAAEQAVKGVLTAGVANAAAYAAAKVAKAVRSRSR